MRGYTLNGIIKPTFYFLSSIQNWRRYSKEIYSTHLDFIIVLRYVIADFKLLLGCLLFYYSGPASIVGLSLSNSNGVALPL